MLINKRAAAAYLQNLLFVIPLSVGIMIPSTLSAESDTPCYLFSYFKGNGEDGLHLAYSNDGLKWTTLSNDRSFLEPRVGESKLMRDPCIIKGPDGKFHMVWTAGWYEKGIGIAHSEDLIHWSEQKYIPVMAHEPTARNTWAPEIFYDDKQEQYLIFWSTTIPGRFPATESSGDNGLNHRIYYVATRDFETYSDTRLFYEPGFNVIDATINKVSDNQYVMFLKNETRHPPEKNIRVSFAESPTGPWSAASEPITGDYWAEGPTAFKAGDYWYVYFDKYTEHTYGAVRSTDLQNWEDISDQIEFPTGARHGTVLKVECDLIEKLKAVE
ncbi:MAG: glycoside hydrolase family 43 protein [bacterium]|jgi:beta-xylosidase